MEQNNELEGRPGVAIKKLVFGLCLVVVGTAAFLGAIDVWSVRHLWKFWPLLLIAAGVSHEIEALQRRRADGGYIMLAVGCWLLVGTFHLFGLTVREAMPIGLVVAGFFVVVHALIDRPTVTERNNDHVS